MDFLFHAYRVSEIAQRLRALLTDDDVLSDVWVQGEISNCTKAASGHLYFSLKDAGACLKSVMWKGPAGRLAHTPHDGEAVYAHGHFDLYEVRGDVQFYADELQFIGAGLLFQQFEALKRRLDQEGLFAPERKRPLPRFPRRIGVATSREGAVLQDIKHILERRYPLPEIFLAPCTVQGEAAPLQIVAALQTLQKVPGLDVIILARGGGSFEDLWCFNDERVARAIVASRVPVVSGVGHETDFTIADFCADVRAPTPTAAAQFCTPDQNELRAALLLDERRLTGAARAALDEARRRLGADTAALERASPRMQIANRRQQVDDLTRTAAALLERRLALQRERLRGVTRHLEALNPHATLDRGYAIVRRGADGQVITSIGQVQPGDSIQVRVRDGEFGARVE
ncbi:MAG: exodeoxyribonuclease VII large subunit [Anaerolineae bacterium]